MRNPTPVTTRIITELSGSRRKPQSALKVPRAPLAKWKGSPATQVYWTTSCILDVVPANSITAAAESRNDSSTMPGQKMAITAFPAPEEEWP